MTHGGRVYEFAREHGIDIKDILDFSANINPLGPPKSALQAIEANLPLITHYPDATHRDVKLAISERLHIDDDAVLCGNGATEVMELLFREVAPNRIIVFHPAFSEYRLIAERMGVELVGIPLVRSTTAYQDASLGTTETFSLPLQALQETAKPGDLVVLNNPHNPTSAFWHPLDWWSSIEPLCRAGVFVAVDESFIDFLPDVPEISVMGKATRNPNLFVIRSATKIFSIPGLRFGYGIGHPELVAKIDASRDGWSVNALAQAATAYAMRDDTFFEATWRWLSAEKKRVLESARPLSNLRMFKPSVNFVLTEFSDARTAWRTRLALERRGILSRSCDNFTGLDERHVRFAIRSKKDNIQLWSLIHQTLKDDGY